MKYCLITLLMSIGFEVNSQPVYVSPGPKTDVRNSLFIYTGGSSVSYSSYLYRFEFGEVAIKTDSTFKKVIGMEVFGDTSKVLNEFGRRAAIGYYVAEAIKRIKEGGNGCIYIDGKKYLFTLKEIE